MAAVRLSARSRSGASTRSAFSGKVSVGISSVAAAINRAVLAIKAFFGIVLIDPYYVIDYPASVATIDYPAAVTSIDCSAFLAIMDYPISIISVAYPVSITTIDCPPQEP